MTGSGKTEILNNLKNRGFQVLELETLAHHKGSAFGPWEKQPRTVTNNLRMIFLDSFINAILTSPSGLKMKAVISERILSICIIQTDH